MEWTSPSYKKQRRNQIRKLKEEGLLVSSFCPPPPDHIGAYGLKCVALVGVSMPRTAVLVSFVG